MISLQDEIREVEFQIDSFDVKDLEDFKIVQIITKNFPERQKHIEKLGGLDIPKLSLKEIIFDREAKKLTIRCGGCSFFAIYFTHYFADVPLSDRNIKENDSQPVTLRRLFEKSMEEFLSLQRKRFESEGRMSCFPHLPNPLGITGLIYSVDKDNEVYVLLRERKRDQIDGGLLDYSFSGLIEITDFLAHEKVSLKDIVKGEVEDETGLSIAGLDKSNLKAHGILFVKTKLYQPELITSISVSPEILKALSKKRGLIVVKWKDLKSFIERHGYKTKDLFWDAKVLFDNWFDTLLKRGFKKNSDQKIENNFFHKRQDFVYSATAEKQKHRTVIKL